MKKELSDYWFPRYPSRWRRKTMHLCPYQDGLYGRLVDHYMETKEPLPDDDAALARICGVSPSDFTPHAATIRAFFTPKKGRLFNKTCEEVLGYQNGKKQRRIESASKAAKILWNKKKGNQEDKCGTHTNRNAKPMRPDAIEQNITEDKKELIDTGIKDTPDLLGAEAGAVTVQPSLESAVEMWNAMAGRTNLPKCQSLNDTRRRNLKNRLKEIGGLDGWQLALEKVENSTFLKGGSPSGWVADFNFMLQQKSLTKIMEGSYDDRKSTSPKTKSAVDSLAAGFDSALAMFEMAERNGGSGGQ